MNSENALAQFTLIQRNRRSSSGFSRNLRKEVSKQGKIYFWDLGVRNAAIDNLKPLTERDGVGALWENSILADRLKWLHYHQTLASLYLRRTYTGAEIDIVEEASVFVSASRSRWIAKSGGQGGDLAIPAEQVAQTKIMAFKDLSATATCTQVATYVYNVVKAANASGTAMNAMLKAQMLATALDGIAKHDRLSPVGGHARTPHLRRAWRVRVCVLPLAFADGRSPACAIPATTNAIAGNTSSRWRSAGF